MAGYGFLSSFVAVSLLVTAAKAKPPPAVDPSLGRWFQSLEDPETTLSCCDEADCRPVDARVARDHHEVLVGGVWTRVPEQKVLHRTDNPTGGAVLCWNKALGIMCFVPGPGA